MAFTIYKHTCIVNGKSYIGQTCQTNLNIRFKNGKGYKKQAIFYKAIRKYGWENFTHEVLENNIKTTNEANEREKYWIAYYHTFINDPDCNGYNMTPGGDGYGGYLLSKAVYQVDSSGTIINSFCSKTEAARALGVNNSAYINRCCKKPGIYSTKQYYFCHIPDYEICKNNLLTYKQAKQKMIADKKRKADEKKRQNKEQVAAKKIILQIDANLNIVNEFVSVSDAEHKTGISHSSISSCCNNRQHFARGYYWCYKYKYDTSIFTGLNPACNEKVYQLDKEKNIIKIYPNVADAQKQTGLTNIYGCCISKKHDSTGGYYWCLESQLSTFNVKEHKYKQVAVAQFTLDNKLIKVHDSMSAIAKELGLHQALISKCCTGKRKTTGGYIWKYYNNGDNI